MLFESKPSAFEVLVRSEQKIYQGGVHIDTVQALTASFATHEGEMTYEDEDGSTTKVALIRGHFLDTHEAQIREGWTDEERVLVEKSLEMQCKKTPEWVWVKEIPKAVAPWPSYDKITNYLKVASLAEELGLVREALDYERATKNREGVVAELEKRLEDVAEVEAMTAA